MISVVPYEPAHRRRWNQFVRTARNGLFLFEREYMEYHADRFAEASLMFENRHGLVAVLPAHRRRDPDGGPDLLCSHEGLTFGGLITGPDMRLALMEEVFDVLTGYMEAAGFGALRYRAIPHIYARLPGEEDLWCLHSRGARIIDVRVGCAVRAGGPSKPSKSFRQRVRKAAKTGLEVRPWDDIDAFHGMLGEWLRVRHDAVPVHSAADLRRLQGAFPDRIRILGAWREGRPVAGEMMFVNPACIRLQYFAGTSEGIEAGAGSLLEDHILAGAPRGCWIDLGTSMDQSTGRVAGSLHAHKESLGARAVLCHAFELRVRPRSGGH